MREEKNKYDLITGIAVTAVVSILVIIGMCFHEPWFDEAQAYLLARDASLRDILMHWTHYEGHPPLWHLLLRCATALGMSFETAIKSVNFLFVEAVLLLIEFRSPFRRITKVIIPTSYFLMYQYSVTSRPYMMLTFFCLLAAMCYNERYEKPMRYCCSLLLMCISHSFGIAFAGGIVIADMLGESIRQRSVRKMAVRIISNKRVLLSYVMLLAGALAMVAVIMPRSDTYATSSNSGVHGFAFCYFMSWLHIPSDTLFTSFSSELMYMREETNPVNEVITAAVISLIIWILLFCIAKKRRMIAEVFLPYSFIAVLTSIHTLPHHYGIFLMYLLFMLWTATDKERITLKEFAEPLEKAGLKADLTKKIAIGGAAAFTAINLYWDGLSYYREIKYAYDPARSLAQWIKDNELEDRKILTTWSENDAYIVNASSVASNAYFDRNIYYNLNYGLSFISHKACSGDDAVNIKKEWLAMGEPDLMVCDTPQESSYICKDLGIDSDYIALAYTGEGKRIFKDKIDDYNLYVMCTRETYKEIYGKDYEVSTYRNS